VAAIRLRLRIAPGLSVPRTQQALWNGVARSEMYRGYAPLPYAGRLTLFLATRRSESQRAIPQLGWREHAAGGFDVHEVEGNHASVLTSDVRGLVVALNACLREARDSHGSG
jgi:hypothetical protein